MEFCVIQQRELRPAKMKTGSLKPGLITKLLILNAPPFIAIVSISTDLRLRRDCIANGKGNRSALETLS